MINNPDSPQLSAQRGFTLIELAIVMVIIGLVVGGILTGRDLIESGYARATLTQISKYTQAANTFRSKYDYWPGDIPAPYATQFGFIARGTSPGWGDGNGLIQGSSSFGNYAYGHIPSTGEADVFWRDLYTASLIEDKITNPDFNTQFYPTSTDPSLRFPPAKIGSGNYVYVYGGSGGTTLTPNTDANYFGISVITSVTASSWQVPSTPGLTVRQAALLDAKSDDGLPQSGRTQAFYINHTLQTSQPTWAKGGGVEGANSSHLPTTAATAGSSTTCYDNNNSAGSAQQYSTSQNNGSGMNCALSFRFK